MLCLQMGVCNENKDWVLPFEIGFTYFLLLFQMIFIFYMPVDFFICMAVYIPLLFVYFITVNASYIVHGSPDKLYRLENI